MSLNSWQHLVIWHDFSHLWICVRLASHCPPHSLPLPIPLQTDVLNASAFLEMTVFTVNRAVSHGCPLESSDSQGTSSLIEVSIQATSAQPSGAPDAQEIPEKTEDIQSAVVQEQEAAADPVGCCSDLTVPGNCVPQADEGNVLTEEAQMCANEEVAPQEKDIPDGMLSGEKVEATADGSPHDSKDCGLEDTPANTEDGNPASGNEAEIQEQKSDPDKAFPGESKVDEATLNENLDKVEPVGIPSQVTKSKGISKCEDTRLSTQPMSGLFIYWKKYFSHLVRFSIK